MGHIYPSMYFCPLYFCWTSTLC